MIPKADQLLAELQERASQAITEANTIMSLDLFITSAYRSPEEQDRLYAQGRTTPGPIVTYLKGGESLHNHRRAFDIADRKRGYNFGQTEWDTIAAIISKYGWFWGGNWSRFKDKPHFEWPFDVPFVQQERKVGMYDPGVTIESLGGEIEDYAILRKVPSDNAPEVDVVGGIGSHFSQGWRGVVRSTPEQPLGRTTDGLWTHVQVGENTGWVKTKYLKAVSSGEDVDAYKREVAFLKAKQEQLKKQLTDIAGGL